MRNSFAKEDIISNSTKKRLRRKIENDIKTVKFVNVDGISYMYPKSISTEHLVSMYVKTQNELNSLKKPYNEETAAERHLVESIKMVKRDINDLDDEMPWPPQPSDLVPEKLEIPRTLDLMLQTLLQTADGKLTTRGETLKLSFAQDLVYAVSRGYQKSWRNNWLLHKYRCCLKVGNQCFIQSSTVYSLSPAFELQLPILPTQRSVIVEIARDENDIQAILSVLQESFVHPFSEQRLLSISTGIAIDQTDSEELLDAFQIGS